MSARSVRQHSPRTPQRGVPTHHNPHLLVASAKLERLLSSEARYQSTIGVSLIRVRFAGVSRREKIAPAIFVLGTAFSLYPAPTLLDQ